MTMENPMEVARQRMLARIDAWDANADKRAVFLRCYADMTVNMIQAIDAGAFLDTEWVQRLLVHFTTYYFDALDAYEHDLETSPVVWRETHRSTRDHALGVIELLVLGINAHINHDLGLAVADLLDPVWASLSTDDRERRHVDYTRVNAIIAETTAVVQRDVVERYSHGLGAVDRVFAPAVKATEWEVGRIICGWREDVWRHAVQLVETREAGERDRIRQTIVDGALHRLRIVLSEVEDRERLLGMPLHELRHLHSRWWNPPRTSSTRGLAKNEPDFIVGS